MRKKELLADMAAPSAWRGTFGRAHPSPAARGRSERVEGDAKTAQL